MRGNLEKESVILGKLRNDTISGRGKKRLKGCRLKKGRKFKKGVVERNNRGEGKSDRYKASLL